MVNLGDKEKLKAYLLEKSTRVGDCLRFTGTHTLGYGVASVSGKSWRVNRLSAYIFHGLDLDDEKMLALHKPECKFKDCWDENHIYVGNHSDNGNDSVVTKVHANAIKTYCAKGHPFNEENTYYKHNGWRKCKICHKADIKARREMNKRLEASKKRRQNEP